MTEHGPETEIRLFRIVRSLTPVRQDVLSDKARGKPLPLDPRLSNLHDGLSMFATLAQALQKARRYPVLGQYIAEIRLTRGPFVRVERTIDRSQGHHTVWADPDALLQSIVRIVPVMDDEKGGNDGL